MAVPSVENVPAELRSLHQWVCWRYEQREGKHTKVPYDPKSRRRASTTDADTWSRLADAVAAGQKFDGIGLVVTEQDDLVGIDLDHCVEASIIASWAMEIIQRLNSYTEFTPSGTGVRIWVRGKLPPGPRRRGQVEMYDAGRYFTVTGNHVTGTPTNIADRQAELDALYATVFQPKEKNPLASVPVDAGSDADVRERIMRSSHDGARFSRLLAGDISDYNGDHSAADLAMMNLLAFYTRGDTAQMERLFRQSGLAREKLDERHRADGATYLQMTIEKALDGRTQFWSAQRPETEPWPEFESTPQPPGGGEQDLRRQALTDLGNAERLLTLNGTDLRYVPPWRSWVVWNGQMWAKDSETARGKGFGHAFRRAAAMVRHMRAQMEENFDKVNDETRKAWRAHIKSCEQHSKLLACLNTAARFSVIGYEELDTHTHLLPVSNGTIDLRTGKLGKHERSHFITHLVDVAFDPNATCPEWERFMRSLFPQGPDLAEWMWQALGYALTGSVLERCVFFLWGSGRNGKSTLLEAFAELLGDYAACIDPKVILMRRFDDGSSHELAQLPGKRYVFTSETGSGRSLNEARLKSLSGADTIQACAKYEAPFSFKPQFKLFMATNHKPVIRGTDHAIWDRIRLIPFTQRFYTEAAELEETPDALPADFYLPEKLRREFPGALARCVRAAREWHDDGLKRNEHVVAATASYRKDSDLLGTWLRECCETGSGLEARSSELWTSYGAWCERTGEAKGTRNAFGTALRERGFHSFERGRHDKAFWRGLKLAETQEESEFDDYEPGSTG